MSNNQEREKGAFERAGEAMGEVAGRVAGQFTDAAMNVTGAVFNSMASMLGNWWSGPEAQRAATSFGEQQDQECRRHFEARSSGRDYTTTRPLYQLGHVAGRNPDYRDRSYGEVEPELRRAWESSSDSSRYGRWDDVSAYVKFGFDQGGTGASGSAGGQAGSGGVSGGGHIEGQPQQRTPGSTGTGGMSETGRGGRSMEGSGTGTSRTGTADPDRTGGPGTGIGGTGTGGTGSGGSQGGIDRGSAGGV